MDMGGEGSGRPRKKKSFWEAKKRREGELAAEREDATLFLDGRLKIEKRLWLFMQPLLKKLDPGEILAVGAMTVLVKMSIEASEGIQAHIVIFMDNLKKHAAANVVVYGATTATFGIAGLFANVISQWISQEEEAAKLAEKFDLPQVEIVQWLTAFVIAYILYKHGGDILAFGENSIGKLATLLLAT